MESGETKTAVLGAAAVAILALGAWFVFTSRNDGESAPQNSRRGEILELASRARVSDSEKKRLFEYLSGEQFREYQFNDRERALILKAIGG